MGFPKKPFELDQELVHLRQFLASIGKEIVNVKLGMVLPHIYGKRSAVAATRQAQNVLFSYRVVHVLDFLLPLDFVEFPESRYRALNSARAASMTLRRSWPLPRNVPSTRSISDSYRGLIPISDLEFVMDQLRLSFRFRQPRPLRVSCPSGP